MTDKKRRIDLLIGPKGDVSLTCPDFPGLEYPVTPDDGTEEHGVAHAIHTFQKKLEELAHDASIPPVPAVAGERERLHGGPPAV
jgi:hypothetical protein